MFPFQQYTPPIFHLCNRAVMAFTAIAGILAITLQVWVGDGGGTRYSHTPKTSNHRTQ